ncbi:cytochrome P450 [Xanthomonas sp. 1678]|uniref:cytochrome P450 n=1 Tax=Xanthomonas sp. 1678 TaxID=3158788 RepID=UPI002865AABF|nr:fatty-acid peroxygenase [Xanthomonas translucens]
MQASSSSSSPQVAPFPRLAAMQVARGLRRAGYAFVSEQCERLHSDVFQTRMLLRPAVFARGAEAVAAFYHPGRFTRRGALPPTTVALLQGFGSVQRLDGDAHLQRKRLFRTLLAPGATAALVAEFRAQWRERAREWERMPQVILQREAELVLCRAACRWAGVPLDDAQSRRRAGDFAAMIDGAGSAGTRWWRGWWRRKSTERWIRGVIRGLRREAKGDDTRPAAAIAAYRDAQGRALSVQVAAVEVINLLRPTVAVARWITFAALALHQHPQVRHRLRQGEPGLLRNVVQEVRRFYPFFPMVGGRVRTPFQWRGRSFRRGEWMMVDLYGTNHDPALWTQPQRFDPDRFRDWSGGGFDLVPQGGGSVEQDHRCPGEDPAIALLMAAVDELATGCDYEVPAQDLDYPLDRFPTLPRSGFVIRAVRLRDPASGS